MYALTYVCFPSAPSAAPSPSDRRVLAAMSSSHSRSPRSTASCIALLSLSATSYGSSSSPSSKESGTASRKIRSSSTITGSFPSEAHGTLRRSEPRKPALMVTGRLNRFSASVLSLRLFSTTSPAAGIADR